MRNLNHSVSLAAALTLAACGGGDSGGGNSDKNDRNDSQTTEPTSLVDQAASNAIQSQLPDGDNVTVAVLDQPIDIEHGDLDGLTISGFNASELTDRLVFDEDPDKDVDGLVAWQSGNGNHGQAATSVMAGEEVGYGKNLDVVYGAYDRDDRDAALSVDATIGAGEAAKRGAQAINISYGYDPVSEYKDAEANPSVNEYELNAFEQVRNNDSVIIVSAGNQSQSVSVRHDAENTWDATNDMYEHTLVVGATDGNGNLADFSNVAGANEAVQKRYLVAPGLDVVAAEAGTDDGFTRVYGTSFAAPVATAAIGELISIWPESITAVEAAQHLLDTADRSFTDAYGKTDCGPENNTNCGLYRFGQGRLDWRAVLEPSGTLGVLSLESASVDTVDADKEPITKTSLTLPVAMRSVAEPLREAVSEVHAFDELGRNYVVDLSGSIQTAPNPDLALNGRLSRFLDTGLDLSERSERHGFGAYGQAVHYNGDGSIRSSHVSTPLNADWSLTADMFLFNNNGSTPSQQSPVQTNLVTYQGHTPLNQQLRDGYGFSTGTNLTPGIEWRGTYWTARNRVEQGGRSDRIWYNIETGVSRIHETDGFLGMTGDAGLSTENGSNLTLAHVQGEIRYQDWTGFASYQRGRASASFENSLLTGVDASVEKMAFGGEYDVSNDTRFAVSASTPLTVRDGNAELRLASGVKSGGDIAYRHEDVRLDGGERAMRFEAGATHRLNEQALLGVNVINAPVQAGGGERTNALAVRYSTKF